MNFYDAQARARGISWRLLALFTLLLTLLSAILSALAVFIAALMLAILQSKRLQSEMEAAQCQPDCQWLYWQLVFDLISPALIVTVTVLVFGALLGYTWQYLARLSHGGGHKIARALGGQRLARSSGNTGHKRLLNVVEEMAIASGVPVPPVYLLAEEDSINAFAAGYSNRDAVIGVTQGVPQRLSRDEMQAVMAHEFSHILNGDARINMRLMAVVHTMVGISMWGRRVVARSRRGGGYGWVLLMVGSLGTFFGRIIMAAVSRQRELLADASAVQFTRNPDSVVNALRKIGGQAGSLVNNEQAMDKCHMFFGQSFRTRFDFFFATHPSVEQRIRAIQPRWDGSFLNTYAAEDEPQPDAEAQQADAGLQIPGMDAVTQSAGANAAIPAVVVASATVSGAVGMLEAKHILAANQIVKQIPEPLLAAAHDALGARMAVLCLLIATDVQMRRAELARISEACEAGALTVLTSLLKVRADLPAAARLPLLRLCAATLKELSAQEYRNFRDLLVQVIRMDGRVDRFEWVLYQVLTQELQAHFNPAQERAGGTRSISNEADACARLLSMLAHVGHQDAAMASTAFANGMHKLGLTDKSLLAAGDLEAKLPAIMNRLRMLAALDQQKLVAGCLATVMHDGKITGDELDLIQGVAAALDIPLPLLRASV